MRTRHFERERPRGATLFALLNAEHLRLHQDGARNGSECKRRGTDRCRSACCSYLFRSQQEQEWT
jgi:hypothetical protein